MAVKIAVANQKGGVGKTTTAVNLADTLIHFGCKVLFIDLDPQHNSTSTYGAEITDTYTIVDVMKKDCSVKEAIQTTPIGDIIAGDELLAQEETFFNAQKARENILKRQIGQIDEDYDYIIIDTPPNLGIYMYNALTAADGCIIPIKAEKYSVDGLGLLIETINEVISVLNENLKVYGVLMSMYDSRNSLDRNILGSLPQVGEQKGFHVFSTPIRICQSIKNVQAIMDDVDADNNIVKANRSIFENDKFCNAAYDYVAFTKEVVAITYPNRKSNGFDKNYKK